ncbi:MAG: hypothetical protein BWY82_02080 [Verrucomicrobia bacterium ADurb.Bin474]|nr:MAG: hypothetical protein BWY82_02080 [Verrucomicrobia bacterium ADurb.Bin474]
MITLHQFGKVQQGVHLRMLGHAPAFAGPRADADVGMQVAFSAHDDAGSGFSLLLNPFRDPRFATSLEYEPPGDFQDHPFGLECPIAFFSHLPRQSILFILPGDRDDHPVSAPVMIREPGQHLFLGGARI